MGRGGGVAFTAVIYFIKSLLSQIPLRVHSRTSSAGGFLSGSLQQQSVNHGDGAESRRLTYRSASEGQVETKQQGMSCGMTAAQKPCEPPGKASASSLITLQLPRHRSANANRDSDSAAAAAAARNPAGAPRGGKAAKRVGKGGRRVARSHRGDVEAARGRVLDWIRAVVPSRALLQARTFEFSRLPAMQFIDVAR